MCHVFWIIVSDVARLRLMLDGQVSYDLVVWFIVVKKLECTSFIKDFKEGTNQTMMNTNGLKKYG